jgi:threonine/homoserine/homoserine lactone efflux protein
VIFAIIKQSLTNGHKAGYAFVVGVSLSDLSILFICNIFTSFFALALTHKATIAMAGAGFLFLLGLYTLLFKEITIENIGTDEEKKTRFRDLLGIFVSGFLMNTLNPSVFLFWFAWTAAISSDAAEMNNPTMYKIIVFGTCLIFVLISDLSKVYLAKKLRPRLTNKSLVWINKIAGIIILLFSAVLFYNALKF